MLRWAFRSYFKNRVLACFFGLFPCRGRQFHVWDQHIAVWTDPGWQREARGSTILACSLSLAIWPCSFKGGFTQTASLGCEFLRMHLGECKARGGTDSLAKGRVTATQQPFYRATATGPQRDFRLRLASWTPRAKCKLCSFRRWEDRRAGGMCRWAAPYHPAWEGHRFLSAELSSRRRAPGCSVPCRWEKSKNRPPGVLPAPPICLGWGWRCLRLCWAPSEELLQHSGKSNSPLLYLRFVGCWPRRHLLQGMPAGTLAAHLIPNQGRRSSCLWESQWHLLRDQDSFTQWMVASWEAASSAEPLKGPPCEYSRSVLFPPSSSTFKNK